MCSNNKQIPQCFKTNTQVHHIDCKGMGGSKLKDYIENLMALCQECHDKYGDKKQYMEYLQEIHNANIR